MTEILPPLAVSLGDPAGIGPEIICASYDRLRSAADVVPFAVCGGMEVLRAAARLSEIDCPLIAIDRLDHAADAFASGLPVLAGADAEYTPQNPSRDGAKLAKASLEQAAQLALGKEASGVVTAPVAKAQLMKAGFGFPGQTEFFAAVGSVSCDNAVMMLAGPSVRAVPLTVHVALADVPGLLSVDLIVNKARIVAAGLTRDFGIANPRLAIAGLNPHAGEAGQFGDEEERVIEPACAKLQSEGFNVIGPVPGDALFTPMKRATYDAALCMYHDQALIPIKALDFDEGVNVTLGLPIVRTSPDHGTAFDIAGTGAASPSAMCAAIKMASACALARAGG